MKSRVIRIAAPGSATVRGSRPSPTTSVTSIRRTPTGLDSVGELPVAAFNTTVGGTGEILRAFDENVGKLATRGFPGAGGVLTFATETIGGTDWFEAAVRAGVSPFVGFGVGLGCSVVTVGVGAVSGACAVAAVAVTLAVDQTAVQPTLDRLFE